MCERILSTRARKDCSLCFVNVICLRACKHRFQNELVNVFFFSFNVYYVCLEMGYGKLKIRGKHTSTRPDQRPRDLIRLLKSHGIRFLRYSFEYCVYPYMRKLKGEYGVKFSSFIHNSQLFFLITLKVFKACVENTKFLFKSPYFFTSA